MPTFLLIEQILSDKTATDKAKIQIIEKLTYYNAILSSKKYFYF